MDGQQHHTPGVGARAVRIGMIVASLAAAVLIAPPVAEADLSRGALTATCVDIDLELARVPVGTSSDLRLNSSGGTCLINDIDAVGLPFDAAVIGEVGWTATNIAPSAIECRNGVVTGFERSVTFRFEDALGRLGTGDFVVRIETPGGSSGSAPTAVAVREADAIGQVFAAGTGAGERETGSTCSLNTIGTKARWHLDTFAIATVGVGP